MKHANLVMAFMFAEPRAHWSPELAARGLFQVPGHCCSERRMWPAGRVSSPRVITYGILLKQLP
jgi:hypothetical protein